MTDRPEVLVQAVLRGFSFDTQRVVLRPFVDGDGWGVGPPMSIMAITKRAPRSSARPSSPLMAQILHRVLGPLLPSVACVEIRHLDLDLDRRSPDDRDLSEFAIERVSLQFGRLLTAMRLFKAGQVSVGPWRIGVKQARGRRWRFTELNWPPPAEFRRPAQKYVLRDDDEVSSFTSFVERNFNVRRHHPRLEVALGRFEGERNDLDDRLLDHVCALEALLLRDVKDDRGGKAEKLSQRAAALLARRGARTWAGWVVQAAYNRRNSVLHGASPDSDEDKDDALFVNRAKYEETLSLLENCVRELVNEYLARTESWEDELDDLANSTDKKSRKKTTVRGKKQAPKESIPRR